MNDIVLVPTYYRPEYLSLCLEYLSKARGIETKEVWVCQDFRQHDEHRHYIEEQWTAAVIDDWRKKLSIRFIRSTPHIFQGNTQNVMEAYRRAYETDARFVYLVEDDVFVMPDFFEWHEAVQAEDDYFCSVAYRCIRNQEARTDVDDPNAYFTTARDYASIGVCWKRDKLKHLALHASTTYYSDTDAYMLRAFPGNRFGDCFSEQDGLIMRVMWEQNGVTAWPYVPRAYHMGWYGYHRPNGSRPNGHLEQKIQALISMISDADRLKIAAPDYGDIEPLPTSVPGKFSKLYKIQHFD